MKQACVILMTCLIVLTMTSAQTVSDEFREPWKDQTRAFVLDAFGGNELDCSALAKEPRVASIIFRASKGLISDAKQYDAKKAECKSLGYKWGSFHVGKADNPVAQADFYLATAKPEEDEVMALDLEDITKRGEMNLADTQRFIKRIKEKTGRYPLLYITGSGRDELLKSYGADSEFANTPLWYVRVRNDISSLFPARPLWNTYTLWQFASELNCCRKQGKRTVCTSTPPAACPFRTPIPGTKFDMDVDVYYGTVDELRSRWPHIGR